VFRFEFGPPGELRWNLAEWLPAGADEGREKAQVPISRRGHDAKRPSADQY